MKEGFGQKPSLAASNFQASHLVMLRPWANESSGRTEPPMHDGADTIWMKNSTLATEGLRARRNDQAKPLRHRLS